MKCASGRTTSCIWPVDWREDFAIPPTVPTKLVSVEDSRAKRLEMPSNSFPLCGPFALVGSRLEAVSNSRRKMQPTVATAHVGAMRLQVGELEDSSAHLGSERLSAFRACAVGKSGVRPLLRRNSTSCSVLDVPRALHEQKMPRYLCGRLVCGGDTPRFPDKRWLASSPNLELLGLALDAVRLTDEVGEGLPQKQAS
jgi:hypothetical protein